MVVALGVLWAFANIPPHYLMRLAFPLYVLGVLLLASEALSWICCTRLRRSRRARVWPDTLTVPLMCVEFFLLLRPYGAKQS